ncbi:Uncharacterized protein dnm_078970 [Desulfonema magnum]|uniref:Uncharacterized protein n=1 Tax=Desulfonema magnum TaxID=45655 RepID=A0A975BUE5_9BACT|nr:Uncharacterized protein dnm_078970 [Desulfonema magnum]
MRKQESTAHGTAASAQKRTKKVGHWVLESLAMNISDRIAIPILLQRM